MLSGMSNFEAFFFGALSGVFVVWLYINYLINFGEDDDEEDERNR